MDYQIIYNVTDNQYEFHEGEFIPNGIFWF